MRPRIPGALLRHTKTPAFLLTDATNIRYLTGLDLHDDGRILVTPRRSILFVSALNRYMADQQAPRGMVVRDRADLPLFLNDIRECGFEADTVSISHLSIWKKKMPHTKFIQKSDVLREFRRSKEEHELRVMKRADRITQELLRRVPSMLRKSITEEKLARQLQIWALELGADGMSFDPIVGFGTHTSSPHHRPTNRSLKKGHIVQIDIGVKVQGYCSDASEVYFTAKPTPLQQRMYQTVCEAQAAALDLIAPGVSTHALDRAARDVLKREGIEDAFCHGLGHGVGLEIHEGVSISMRGKDEKLLKNEVITIEPGVYFPGRFGMRVEKMVVVT